MKLLYLSNLRLPTEKAYGIQIAKMCDAFALEGLSVTLVYPFRENDIKDNIFSYYSVKENFKIKKIWALDFYLPRKLDRVAVGIKSFISAVHLSFYALFINADIIYSRDEMPLYFLSFFKRNLVFEAHRFSSKRRIFYKRFNKKGVKIVVISKAIKTDLVISGYDSDKILVARDGVDLEEFKVQMNKNEARESFFSNLHGEVLRRKKIAVYIGSLYPWKGADVLIKVTEYLKNINPNYFIWIVGGSKNDVEVLKKGLHPNIVPFIYINGAVPHKEVAKILIAADCAILTGKEDELNSAKYTSPLKMFEYMASGCPIVAQDLPSFREVLDDQNSILVKAGDSEELANGIFKIFKSLDDDNPEDPGLPKRISKKAFEDVQEYTWQKRANKINLFFSEIH